jgi:transcriptional regulator with XRE-family HTH domain
MRAHYIPRMAQATSVSPVGSLLREWRTRRHLSQLELALDAGISARHLSFVETGRSRPSAEMVLHLAEQLDVPLRDRNALLLAAGYAPRYDEHSLDDPAMEPVREAIQRVLDGHSPFPAVVVDRHWNLVAANQSALMLLDGVAAHLLEPPLNVLRASLHPEGMAPRIANLEEWREHLLARLARHVAATGDDELAALYAEFAAYPGTESSPAPRERNIAEDIVVQLRLRGPAGELAFFSTVTTFGTAVDITVAELAIEAFFPADEATAAHLRSLPQR